MGSLGDGQCGVFVWFKWEFGFHSPATQQHQQVRSVFDTSSNKKGLSHYQRVVTRIGFAVVFKPRVTTDHWVQQWTKWVMAWVDHNHDFQKYFSEVGNNNIHFD